MATLRIGGLSPATKKHDLAKVAHVGTDCISLARNDTTTSSPLTATITFQTKRSADRFKAQKKHAKCLGKRPRIDSHFLGLTVLSSGEDDEVECVIHILPAVVVHGDEKC